MGYSVYFSHDSLVPHSHESYLLPRLLLLLLKLWLCVISRRCFFLFYYFFCLFLGSFALLSDNFLIFSIMKCVLFGGPKKKNGPLSLMRFNRPKKITRKRKPRCASGDNLIEFGMLQIIFKIVFICLYYFKIQFLKKNVL